jgi:hypothetical protein
MHKHETGRKRVIDSDAPNSVSFSNSKSSDAPECPEHSSGDLSDPHGNPGSHESKTMCDSVAISKPQVAFDQVAAHTLFTHTRNRLHTLFCRVCEGKCVDEASEFSRWVRYCGVLTVLEPFESSGALAVSVAALRKLCGDITWECEQFWKKNPRGPWVSLSELESINAKLDRLAFQFAQFAPSPIVDTPIMGPPVLRVIETRRSA